MYIETSSPNKKGDKAQLISRVFNPIIPPARCSMLFHYDMFGADISDLNVYTRQEVNGRLNKVWSKSGLLSIYSSLLLPTYGKAVRLDIHFLPVMA